MIDPSTGSEKLPPIEPEWSSTITIVGSRKSIDGACSLQDASPFGTSLTSRSTGGALGSSSSSSTGLIDVTSAAPVDVPSLEVLPVAGLSVVSDPPGSGSVPAESIPEPSSAPASSPEHPNPPNAATTRPSTVAH